MSAELAGWVIAASVAMFVGGLLLMPVVALRIPSDYFLGERPPLASMQGSHPALRALVLLVKNVVGLILLAAGISMLVLPGQGLLTIFVALMLLDFPGKRRIELRVVRTGGVLRAINWIRERRGRPALRLPERRRRRRGGPRRKR